VRLTRPERELLLKLLTRLIDGVRLIEDSIIIMKMGKKPSAKKSETFISPLQDADKALRESLQLIGQMMNPTEQMETLMGMFEVEALSMDSHHAKALAMELIDECLPHTALDEIVDALEDPPIPPAIPARHDFRAWVYVQNGKIHIDIGRPGHSDEAPEMSGAFGLDEVESAHEFLVKANVATGLYASSCFHPDEEGLPEDLDVQAWVQNARNWHG
jgi:hypothetical protein